MTRRIRMADTPIDVAYPVAEDLSLRVALGACRFAARLGEGESWVAGICHDPTDKRSPRILDEGSSVTITEAEPSFERIPAVFGGVPRYELEFGKQRPFALTIETGASEFNLDLGGVPLSRLTVRQGAGKFELGFSEMRLSGGAAGYELDFGGELSRDAQVNVETGLSVVEISLQATTAAKIFAET